MPGCGDSLHERVTSGGTYSTKLLQALYAMHVALYIIHSSDTCAATTFLQKRAMSEISVYSLLACVYIYMYVVFVWANVAKDVVN